MNNNQMPQNPSGLKEFFLGKQMERNNIAIIAGVVGLIALFLPYATVQVFGFSQSISYVQAGDGPLVMILILIALGAYIMRRNGIGFIASAIGVLVCLIDFMSILEDSYGMASHSIGAYLSLFAVIVMAAAAFIGRGKVLNR
ncbi:MAG: hypothetical protein Q4E31_05885 [Intestinibacter bartlettii]|uniref:hypothetical protein n=1 Tax=Intestinibacter bartlettii TaxID=261299 RepID=UPI0026F0D869|nr:hypothetical protein [Intestinibacter bartlettii]MDO5010339.1 hypothetical protein [Intestinibacter bartlettii]